MSRIKTKRTLRSFVFYFCLAIFAGILYAYRSALWVAAVGFLNAAAELYDSLAGK